MDIGPNSFYVCHEHYPRCFTLYRGIQLDREQLTRIRKDVDEYRMEPGGGLLGSNYGSGSEGGPITVKPPIPDWFNEECRRELMLGGSRRNEGDTAKSIVSSDVVPFKEYDSTIGGHVICHNDTVMQNERMKSLLKAQLEYYFSRENLAQDRYLKCQMDNDGFVPISTIAGFRKVVALTDNYDLIVQCLRESRQVVVDEAGERVRPIQQRCTIILREMGDKTEEEIRALLSGGPPFNSLRAYGANDEWYVIYCNEETTKTAYLHIQQLKPSICARIKSGPPPDQQLFVQPPQDDALSMNGEAAEPISVFELGKVLSAMGFVPRATYKPGTKVVKVEESGKSRDAPPAEASAAPAATAAAAGGDGPPLLSVSPLPGRLESPPMEEWAWSGRRGGERGEGGGGGGGYGRRAGAGRSSFSGGVSSYRGAREERGGRREGNGAAAATSGSQQQPAVPRSSNGGGRGAMNGGSLTVVTAKQIRGGEKKWPARNGAGAASPPAAAAAAAPAAGAAAGDGLAAAASVSSSSSTTTPFASSWGSSSGGGKRGGGEMNVSAATSSSETFSFEEQSFPSLMGDKKEEEVVKREKKLSFSSVAAGRKEEKEEKRKSFAQCLKNN